MNADFRDFKYDGLVKSKNLFFYVIPAKVRRGGYYPLVLDSRFHGSDGFETFYESIKYKELIE